MERKPFKLGIFLLIDGARADVMESLLQAGELPNMKRFIVDPGASRNAISVFPSTTGPAHAPFITGCTPGTCNIPGIRWFDRMQPNGLSHFRQCRSYVGPGSLYMDTDLRQHIRTIFEFFSRPTGVFSFLNRGLGLFENRTLLAKSWFWFYAHYTGHWQAVDEAAWRFIYRAVEGDTDFIFAVFPAVDELSHYTHPFSDETFEAYRAIDQSFGRLVERLHRQRRLDETLFILSSDHGLTATHTHFELFAFLEQCGLKTLYYPKILKNSVSAVSMISGNAMAHVYLRNGHGWSVRPTHEEIRNGGIGETDLIEAFLQQDAIDLVISRNEEGLVHVRSRNGAADIQEETDAVTYRVLDSDPFGYTQAAPRMTHDQSLALTIDSEYPDAPFQLTHLFRSPRAGDLVLSARKGYDLRYLFEKPEHKSSHGSLHREHMQVPLLINHAIQRPFVRTVDVFPSILELMGYTVTDMIDGQSFV